MRKVAFGLSLALVMPILLVTCGGEKAAKETPKGIAEPEPVDASNLLSIYTVNYPLQYFAERIGGDRVAVTFPVAAGEDPAYWKPTADEVAAYQSADLILLNGAGYAKWLSLASLPQSKLVDTSAGFRERYVPLQEGPVHSHGPGGEHSHKGVAFTTWLDPELAAAQAKVIAETLSNSLPEYRDEFADRYSDLEADLRDLSSQLESATSELEDRPILFSHPVYQYLIRRYGLNARSLHFEPDQMPTEKQWRELDELLSQNPAELMIWEDSPSEETIAMLEKRGIESSMFRPCANTPQSGDFMTIMRQNVEALRAPGR